MCNKFLLEILVLYHQQKRQCDNDTSRFSVKLWINYKETCLYHGYILQSWDYFSSLLHYQYTSTFWDTLNAMLIKLSAVTLELFTHAVFSCHRKTASWGLPSGSKKDEVRGC